MDAWNGAWGKAWGLSWTREASQKKTVQEGRKPKPIEDEDEFLMVLPMILEIWRNQ